jgi:Tfp pilus assembly protein PilN
MIRVNLLSQRKSRQSERGVQLLVLGSCVVIMAAILTYLFVHRPLLDEIARQEAAAKRAEEENKQLEQKTANFEKMEAAFKAAAEQNAAIERLTQARAVPAWMLYELSNLLTRNRQPTMDETAADRVRNDINRGWMDDWDPKHVWITRFEEKGGRFTLQGGAQSDGDMTQLALRLQASAFFANVVPEGGDEAVAKDNGVNYYRFTITGKVRY